MRRPRPQRDPRETGEREEPHEHVRQRGRRRAHEPHDAHGEPCDEDRGQGAERHVRAEGPVPCERGRAHAESPGRACRLAGSLEGARGDERARQSAASAATEVSAAASETGSSATPIVVRTYAREPAFASAPRCSVKSAPPVRTWKRP